MKEIKSLSDIKVYPKPQTPGYYWARSANHFQYYNLIVFIYGSAPYLRYRTWNANQNERDQGSDPDMLLFGPKITELDIENIHEGDNNGMFN